jgi:aspartate carbamoyltransferase catalytic subunit
MEFLGTSIISAKQFDRQDIEYLIDVAERIESNKNDYTDLLKGKIMATLFFEPSTRTRLSFESAMLRLGGSVMSVTSDEASSVSKGETLADTIRTVSNYADIIVIRHSRDGAAKLAQKYSKVPIINAGSGSQEHPTQALLDLLTIKEIKGSIDGLSIGLSGDLKYGRTTHSLAYLLANYKTNLYFISPDQLRMRPQVLDELMRKQVFFKETKRFKQTLSSLDVLYITRIQKERFPDLEEYEEVKDAFIFEKDDLKLLKEDAIIMHPLPRVNEISPDVDSDPRARYFDQVYYGLMMRKAVIASLLSPI